MARQLDGIPLHQDEHFSIMDDVLGDVEKVKQMIGKIHENALKAVLRINDNDKRGAIVLMGQVVEGIELLKEIWKV